MEKNYDVDEKAVVKIATDYFRKAAKSKEQAQHDTYSNS
jgi:hypothetical protein